MDNFSSILHLQIHIGGFGSQVAKLTVQENGIELPRQVGMSGGIELKESTTLPTRFKETEKWYFCFLPLQLEILGSFNLLSFRVNFTKSGRAEIPLYHEVLSRISLNISCPKHLSQFLSTYLEPRLQLLLTG